MTEATADEGALGGIRVLDLTRVLAGPWCAMLLAELGADVIKVESPQGDDTRGWGPPFLGGESAYYMGCNRSKRGVAIDFSSEAGKDLLRRLVTGADVVIENFKSGTLARWGLDDAWFETQAPRVVRCAITGYGSTGSRAGVPGYDFILQAESGLMSISGPAEGPASKYGVAVVDVATGMMAANAIQAALLARTRTGRGQAVEVCLHDTALALLANVGNSHLATGRPAGRFGNGHPTIVPYTTFDCADGAIAIACGNDAQFARLALLLGEPGWVEDPRFARNADRVVNRRDLEALIGQHTARWPGDALLASLREAGIPCGRVNGVAQALADPLVAERGMVVQQDHPRAGTVRSLAVPLRLADTPVRPGTPPPLLGEHTGAVLREVCGLNDGEIAALARQGTIVVA